MSSKDGSADSGDADAESTQVRLQCESGALFVLRRLKALRIAPTPGFTSSAFLTHTELRCGINMR
jgi:hypothetical protein